MIIIDKDDFMCQISDLMDNIQYEPIIIKENNQNKYVMLDYDSYIEVVQFMNRYNLKNTEVSYDK